MKQAIIVGLVCVNVALLLALALGPGASPARGQAIGGRTASLVISGNITRSNDALYLIDTATRRLAVLKFHKQNRRLLLAARRELKADFQRRDLAR